MGCLGVVLGVLGLFVLLFQIGNVNPTLLKVGIACLVAGFVLWWLGRRQSINKRKQEEQEEKMRELEEEHKRRLGKMDELSALELASRVSEIFRRSHAAQVQVSGEDNRYTLEIQTSDGRKFIAVVVRSFQRIGVAEVRELYGLVKQTGAELGYFFTNETFTPQALNFAQDKNLHLVDEDSFSDLSVKYGVQM